MTNYELGKIMVDNYPLPELAEGYQLSDLSSTMTREEIAYIGGVALSYGDINRDGSLN